MALAWAAGICWMAVELVGSAPDEGNNVTAANDAGVSREDVKRLEESITKL